MQTNNFLTFIKSIFLVQIFIIVLIIGVSMEFTQYYPQLQVQKCLLPFSKIKIDNNMASTFLQEVNVAMAGASDTSILPVANFREGIPEQLLVANFQALGLSDFKYENENGRERVPDDIELPAVVQEKEVNRQTTNYSLFNKYAVVLYCTHSAETYIPDSGKAKCEGERGLVNNVAAGMAGNLREQGLNADFINTIHDYPEYDRSYTNSRATVKIATKNRSNLLALFDVHRDSIPGRKTADTVSINGKKSACILIIVGTDQRKPHPNWEENLQFAEKIYAKGEEKYPGLIKGTRTKAGTYNQEFHDHSLVIEVGSDYNTFAEAEFAGELFTEIVVEVLKEEVM